TTATLSPNTEYFITVDEGSFVNASGVNAGTEIYRGITDATAWRFKTKATVDTQRPLLDRQDSTPANNATQIPVNANIVLKFNEPVFANSGNILIKEYSTNQEYRSISVTSSRLTGSGTDTI